MSAGIYNFTLDQGSTWTLQIVYEDPNGTPINLTGYNAQMKVRKKADSSAVVLSLATGGGGIVITGPTGTINITATDEQTATLDPIFYVYDLDLKLGGVITRLIQGQVTVRPRVTIYA